MQVGNAGGTVTVTISKVLSIISSIEALSFCKLLNMKILRLKDITLKCLKVPGWQLK